MTRLAARFAQLKAEGRAGLITYIMGGDPDFETSFEILRGLPAAGADVIELGFPFSDPMADGPIIQKAGQRALKAGETLSRTLDLARRFRAEDAETPLVLMGYLNPVEQMGARAFAAGAAEAGVDGAIIVDLPPEEDAEIREALAERAIALIRLATPTTDAARLTRVLDGASGFLYYVSVAGVTGAAAANAQAAADAVARVRRSSDLPVAVGFGVRDGATAALIARTADAVVVGSALVEAVGRNVDGGNPGAAPGAVHDTVNQLAAAVRGARLEAGASP